MNKIYIINIFVFCIIGLFFFNNIFGENISNKVKMNEVQKTEKEFKELLAVIHNNLKGSTVLEDFNKEQKDWESYKKSRLKTLFPEYVDGVKMEWGSILSQEIAKESIRLNLLRISEIKLFLNGQRETGTDGIGEYKEYVEELNKLKHD